MIKKFIDRVEELKELNYAYKSRQSYLAVIYGRRRIGKTELIKHFMKGKKFVYYSATKELERDQMQRLAKEIGHIIGDKAIEKFGVTGWDMLFDRLSLYKGKEKIIIGIDEFPYLVSSNPALPSILQASLESFQDNSNILLVLSGSSMSMMHNEVLNYSAPLYGRSSAILRLNQLAFEDAIALMQNIKSFEEKMLIYFIFGGIPWYYNFLEDSATLEDVVLKIIGKNDIFLNETSVLLSEEVKNDAKYINTITAIANGVNKPNEIASKLGIFQSNLNRYISLLETMGIVKKDYPITSNELRMAKGGVYRITDHYIFLWAKVLNRYRELLLVGSKEAKELILGSIRTTIAQQMFEYFAIDLVMRASNKGSIFPITKIGRWWGRDASKPNGINEEEIDLVAVNEKTNDILFGECKWGAKPVDLSVLNELKRKSKIVQWRKDSQIEHFALFSRAGFDAELRRVGKKEGVLLFDLDAIEKIVKNAASSPLPKRAGFPARAVKDGYNK